MTTRRDFLRTGSLAAMAAGLALPRSVRVFASPIALDVPHAGDPILKELAMRALDAARSAGATYADVRFTLSHTQKIYSGITLSEEETIGVGVRALVDGFWGFVASPEWNPDEMARLGRVAAEQARVNNWGATGPVVLGDPPPRAEGVWETPIRRDALQVSVEEKLDYIKAAQAYAKTFRNGNASSAVGFKREERTFASTDGSFFSQTIHTALDDSSFTVFIDGGAAYPRKVGMRDVPWFSTRAGGYEVLTDSGLLEAIPGLYEEARRQLTPVPVTVGRYDIVFDATAMAAILSETIGAAMEIDRVMGYETNAVGTSYMSPPSEMLGKPFGTPLLTVTADRTSPEGAATVKWDDDGVATEAFPLIKDGVVVDYATSREHVSTLSAWYAKRNQVPRSHGCASAENGLRLPLVQTPNLRMAPGAHEASFEDLVREVDDGLAVVGGNCYMDFRKLTGQGHAQVVYEIKRGKLGKVIQGGAYLFRAPEFWKSVAAIGGPRSVEWRGFYEDKGQPRQSMAHSVAAVPALVRNISVIDVARKL